MKKPVFTGAAVAIITPFKSTGEVDYEEFGKIIDHQIVPHFRKGCKRSKT